MSAAADRDDDVLDELPPIGSLDEDEEVGFDDPSLESDVEPIDLDEGEGPGLDDAPAGPEELDLAELLGEAAAEDEGERWTEGAEAAGDLLGDDGIRGEGEDVEYGWTDDTEAPGVHGWDENVIDDLGDESILGDAGEEGVDEDLALGGDGDEVELPPLEAGGEHGDELAEDIEFEAEARIDGADLSFEEEEARMSGAALPETLPPSQLAVGYLGPDDEALADVTVAGEILFAAGEKLYRRVGERVEALEATGIEGQELTSVGFDPRDPRRIAVGTRLGGAFLSRDGGESFEAINGWLHAEDESRLSVAFFVTAEPHAEGIRLWGRTRAGALYRSEDFGETWSSPLLPAPVAALAVGQRGGVVAVCLPRNGRAQVAVSKDGGYCWTMREVPGLEGTSTIPDADHHVAAMDDVIVVVREGDAEGPFLSRDGGASWERCARLPSAGPVALVEEGERPVLYAALFFDGADRGVVVREPLDAPEHAARVLDVRGERDRRRIEARGDPEGDNRVLALHAQARGACTVLYAATGAGLFRVEVRAAGRC